MNHCLCARSAKRIAAIIALLAFCLIAGCYERTADGNTSIYRFAWWIGPAVIAGAILSVPIGWALREGNPEMGVRPHDLGADHARPCGLRPCTAITFSSTTSISRQRTDSGSVHRYRASASSNLSEIQYVGVPGSRGRTNYEMQCMTATGQTTIVPAGNLVRANGPRDPGKGERREGYSSWTWYSLTATSLRQTVSRSIGVIIEERRQP